MDVQGALFGRAERGEDSRRRAYSQRANRTQDNPIRPTVAWPDLPKRLLHRQADIRRYGNVRTFVAYAHMERAVRAHIYMFAAHTWTPCLRLPQNLSEEQAVHFIQGELRTVVGATEPLLMKPRLSGLKQMRDVTDTITDELGMSFKPREIVLQMPDGRPQLKVKMFSRSLLAIAKWLMSFLGVEHGRPVVVRDENGARVFSHPMCAPRNPQLPLRQPPAPPSDARS